MRLCNSILLKDFYKVGHIEQYPTGTELVFSNFTPRKEHAIFFGLHYLIKQYLIDEFNETFFKTNSFPDAESTRMLYRSVMRQTLNAKGDFKHIKDLQALGYLPIAIYALPEGTFTPKGVPAMVIYNTHPDFFWVPNMLETLMSCTLWGACNSATNAFNFKTVMEFYADHTCDNRDHIPYQCHDFSMRGMFGVEATVISGMAHLHYFKGTDNLPAAVAKSRFYETSMELASIPATEHSVMSAGGQDNELGTIKRLLDIYPSGYLSIVSDTWNLWHVITDILPQLKDQIMARDGKIVIRPDSGNPRDIICGSPVLNHQSQFPEWKGVIELLWEIFGGTVNSKGYKVLDSHIGCIYGDGISLEVAHSILDSLKNKGFASSNIVFGIGSYTYQYATRDTLGWAMKSTYCEINGEGRAITKNPITDTGLKKSASGLLKVVKKDGDLTLQQNCTWDEFHADDNELKLTFKDGKYYGNSSRYA